MRLFIALELPDLLRRELGARVALLRKALDGQTLRWVPGPNWHLTLRFLGDTPTEAVKDLTHNLDRFAVTHSPLSLRLTSHGAFPRTAQPSVLWMGLDDGEALQALAADLPKALGLEAEAKPFVPHLTVARVPFRAGRKDRRQIGSILEGLRGCETSSSELANTVSLFQSRLDSSGAKYIRLHSADLTQKKDP